MRASAYRGGLGRIPKLLWLVLGLAACPPLQTTWPKYHHDMLNTGRSQVSTSANPGALKWAIDVGGAIHSSPAVADDGTIYVGSGDGNLYAVNPTGTLKWKVPMGTGDVRSSPLVAADGTVYVGGPDAYLYAVNPSGSVKWKFFLGGGPTTSSPAVAADGTVYIGSNNGTLYAITPGPGSPTAKWTFSIYPGPSIVGAPAVASDGTIYIGGALCPDFYAVDATGMVKWTRHIGGPGTTSPSIAGDGTVYFGVQGGVMDALDPTGALKWLFIADKTIVDSAPAIAADGTVYVGSMDRYLYAVDPANGMEKWRFATDAGIRGSAPAVGADGTIYVGSTDGALYAVNADGSLRWSYLTDLDVNSSPAIGADGTVYVGSDDHHLYAFGVGPSPTGTTPSPTPTETPGPLCGNGVIDPGEDCDPVNSLCPNAAPGFFCSAACQCACPKTLEFTGVGMGGVLDRGWTGLAHDVPLTSKDTSTVAITSCTGPSRPCGVCSFTGPVANKYAANYAVGTGVTINNRRCTNDTGITCHSNAGCGGGGTCEYYAGTLVPITIGGVSACIEQRYQGPITGTVDIETGAIASNAVIVERIFGGMTMLVGCPRCLGDPFPNDGKTGGTCAEGLDIGAPCDVNGASPNEVFGSTSLGCRPSTSVLAQGTYRWDNTTGTVTKTLDAASPNCRAVGFTGSKCMCDTCNNAAATPCSSNADCTAVGATICGGLRCTSGPNQGGVCTVAGTNSQCPSGSCGHPGRATEPNQCDGGPLDCAPGGTPGPNDGVCQTGPVDFFCAPNGTMISCSDDTDCAAALLRSCVGGTRAGHVCYRSCVGGFVPGQSCVDSGICGPGGSCTGPGTAPTDCPGGTCELEKCTGAKARECFLDNGQIGGHDDATGQAVVPAYDHADPTLANLSCVGPTSSSAANSAVGLPGLQRVERVTHIQGWP